LGGPRRIAGAGIGPSRKGASGVIRTSGARKKGGGPASERPADPVPREAGRQRKQPDFHRGPANLRDFGRIAERGVAGRPSGAVWSSKDFDVRAQHGEKTRRHPLSEEDSPEVSAVNRRARRSLQGLPDAEMRRRDLPEVAPSRPRFVNHAPERQAGGDEPTIPLERKRGDCLSNGSRRTKPREVGAPHNQLAQGREVDSSARQAKPGSTRGGEHGTARPKRPTRGSKPPNGSVRPFPGPKRLRQGRAPPLCTRAGGFSQGTSWTYRV